MSTTATLETSLAPRAWQKPLVRVDAQLARLETLALGVALFTSAGCATLAFLSRRFDLAGSAWLDLLPRYATLSIAFLGAALATHTGSHIAIDVLAKTAPPKVGQALTLLAEWVSALVAALLAYATWQFIQSEREGGTLILDVVPTWVPALVMLWGFALTAVRFVLRASLRSPLATLIALSLLAALVWTASPTAGVFGWILGGVLVAGMIAGAPIFVVMGGAALLLFWLAETELAIVPIEVYRLVDAPALATLPLFTFLGAILAKGHAASRLVSVARAWLGWLPGGITVASVVVCAFFTTFTGASGVTILALGLLLHKLLKEEGYDDNRSIGLITSSGSIGLLFPPALPLIIYGIVGNIDIDQLFVAGVVPGIVLVVAVSTAALLRTKQAATKRHPFVARDALNSLRGAAWDLALPVLILGLWRLGWASMTEAAAVAVFYALAVGLFVKRDVRFADITELLRDACVLIGAVLAILGVAIAFTGYLVDAEVPQLLVEWTRAHVHSRWMFLLAVNLLLLVVGCLLDIFSAIVVFVPLLTPVAAIFGVHPVHLAIIFLANLELGYLTPPVGMNLFLSSFRFGKPLPEIWRYVAPFLVALVVALIIITYVPVLSLFAVP